jgi:G3E family GTPase
VGDFGEALKKVLDEYSPDRILIEPSGVGKLSDVIRAVQNIGSDNIVLNGFTTVVDAKKCKMYMKNFGEFFNDQIEHASSIILSHTDTISEEKLEAVISLLREHNLDATIVTTPWDDVCGCVILKAMEQKNTLEIELEKLKYEHHHHDSECDCHNHEHHHVHDEHHHDEHSDCHEHNHEHHHHEHDEHCDCHDHEHHHEHGEECTCGCHHEHGHHHADDVFASFGKETTKKFTLEEIENALKCLEDESTYGIILRAKGIVAGTDGSWIHFDYIPGEPDIRRGNADIIGRLCVIGANINNDALEELFKI